MRVLLDGSLPRRLKRDLPGHEVATVQEMGWDGLKDPQLLDAMIGKFDVLVTVDKNMRFQNQIEGRPICVVVLQAARTNKYEEVARYLSAVRRAIEAPALGAFVVVT